MHGPYKVYMSYLNFYGNPTQPTEIRSPFWVKWSPPLVSASSVNLPCWKVTSLKGFLIAQQGIKSLSWLTASSLHYTEIFSIVSSAVVKYMSLLL